MDERARARVQCPLVSLRFGRFSLHFHCATFYVYRLQCDRNAMQKKYPFNERNLLRTEMCDVVEQAENETQQIRTMCDGGRCHDLAFLCTAPSSEQMVTASAPETASRET